MWHICAADQGIHLTFSGLSMTPNAHPLLTVSPPRVHRKPHVAVLSTATHFCPLSKPFTFNGLSPRVHRKPHVAVLSTGDEVCEPDAPTLQLGQIRWAALRC